MFINYARHSYAHSFYRLNFRFTISTVAANADLLKLIVDAVGAGLVTIRADGLRCDFYCNSLTDIPVLFAHYEEYPFLSFNDHRLSLVDSAFTLYDTES